MKKFSLILPVYNVEKYLAPCVDSILAQKFTDFEVVLVDDGAKDSSPAICDSYAQKDARVRVIHKANGGQGDARNVGLSAAEGEYVFFIDSDDLLYDENVLGKIANKTQETPDVIMHKHIKWFENTNTYSQCDYSYNIDTVNRDFSDIFCELIDKSAYGNAGWNKVIRRALLVDNHIEFAVGISAEDNDWFYQVLTVMKSVALLDEVCYVYRQRLGSVSHSKSNKLIRDQLWIIEKWVDYVSRNKEKTCSKVIMRDLAWQYCSAVIIYSHTKVDKEVYKTLKKYTHLLQNRTNKRTIVFSKIVKVIGLRGLILMLKLYTFCKR